MITIKKLRVQNFKKFGNQVFEFNDDRRTKKKICQGRSVYNFGEAKGLGFDRVLILPTDKYEKFLSGDHSTFSKDDSDGARNKLYVAITRARYSVAFLLDCSSTLLSGIEVWQP